MFSNVSQEMLGNGIKYETEVRKIGKVVSYVNHKLN